MAQPVKGTSSRAPTPETERVRKALTASIADNITEMKMGERFLREVQCVKDHGHSAKFNTTLKLGGKVNINGTDVIVPAGSELNFHINKDGEINLMTCMSISHLQNPASRSHLGWAMNRSSDLNVQQLGRLLRLPSMDEILYRVFVSGHPVQYLQKQIQQELRHPF